MFFIEFTIIDLPSQMNTDCGNRNYAAGPIHRFNVLTFPRFNAVWSAWLLLTALPVIAATSDYRGLGYMYLSPLPGAEYTSTQTRYVLVRFQNISPTFVTNLSTFIQVTGA